MGWISGSTRNGKKVVTDHREVRRIARAARRMGWTPEQLGSFDDPAWDAFRNLVRAPDAPDCVLGEAVDRMISLRMSEDVDPAPETE